MNDILRWVTRSVIGAAVWKAIRRMGPVATLVTVAAVVGVYLVVGR